jgi:hypothetical protein
MNVNLFNPLTQYHEFSMQKARVMYAVSCVLIQELSSTFVFNTPYLNQ